MVIVGLRIEAAQEDIKSFQFPFCLRRCSSVRCQCGEWDCDAAAADAWRDKGETFCTKNVSSQMRFVANAQSFLQIWGKSKTVPNILCGERNPDFSLNWTGNSWESPKMWIRNRRFNQGSVPTHVFSKLAQLTSENGPIGKLVLVWTVSHLKVSV